MEINKILNEQRIYAVLHKVPILRESEVRLFTDLIEMYKPKSVLEIGTAIAYSTLLMADHMDSAGRIISIELDGERHRIAKQFVAQSHYSKQITLLQGDADEVLDHITGTFDMVFLDGPKGQYMKQLKKILPHLEENAVILADNVLFRGYVEGGEKAPKRYQTIITRLREYLAFVRNKELFNTTIYRMGDGMSISIWKGYKKDRENERI